MGFGRSVNIFKYKAKIAEIEVVEASDRHTSKTYCVCRDAVSVLNAPFGMMRRLALSNHFESLASGLFALQGGEDVKEVAECARSIAIYLSM